MARVRRRSCMGAVSTCTWIASTAGVLLGGLTIERPFFAHRQHGSSCRSVSAARVGGGSTTVAAEVQSNGDVAAADLDGTGVFKRRRVSSDVKVRFPVTVVEEQPRRMVVIGDVHGDLDAFAETLLAANLVDESGNWAGGETVLVQAGDIFDRGDADLEVEEWLWTLQEQAKESGGAVYHLLGNHEVMNASGDHSTASRGSFKSFSELDIDDVDLAPFGNQLDTFPDWLKTRLVAMAPNGPVAKMLAAHSVAMKIGDTLLVHGGLRPANFDPKLKSCVGATGMACLENLNRMTHEWLIGKGEMPKQELWDRDSPIWSRYYSSPGGMELGEEAEADLQQVLDITGTVRMVVGHTPQEAGINSALGGRLWRTDTGMTAMIGGQPEALEFLDGVATIITADGRRIPGEKRACRPGKPLPHNPAVSLAQRNGWRGARTIFGGGTEGGGLSSPASSPTADKEEKDALEEGDGGVAAAAA